MYTTASAVWFGATVGGGGTVQAPGARVPASMSELVVDLFSIVMLTAASILNYNYYSNNSDLTCMYELSNIILLWHCAETCIIVYSLYVSDIFVGW